MKCINCGKDFVSRRWPASFRARRDIYNRTGQIPGHWFGTFTCSVRCNYVIAKIRGILASLRGQ